MHTNCGCHVDNKPRTNDCANTATIFRLKSTFATILKIHVHKAIVVGDSH